MTVAIQGVMTIILKCTVVAWIFVSAAALAQPPDWNQWRGPGRDGIASGSFLPASWPDRPKQVWSVPAGIGHSSPVTAGDRVFLFSRIDEQEAMTAYDLSTGKQIWRQAYDAPYRMHPAATGHGKGPKSTPVVDRGRIYALGIGGVFSAFDASTGRLVWREDPGPDLASAAPAFGASMSPLVDGDQVIAHLGGLSAGALVAFNRLDGKRKWAWTHDGPAYASPVLATFGGVRQLITQTRGNLIGVSPVDGRELWRAPFVTRSEQNIITPVVADGLLIYAGLSNPTTAVRPELREARWTLQEVWRNADVPMYMSSPVARGSALYGFSHRNRGQFFAVDLATGRTLWTSPPRQGENAAIVAAGDLLVATTTDGEIAVVRQGTKEFDLVRKYTLSESPIWAHPAFTPRGLLVKDLDRLSYWTF